MDTINLIVDAMSFNAGLNKQSSFTGSIYFDLNGKCFPKKNWNDLVPGVLHMWTENILKLLKDSAFEIQFHFMDGPFIVRGKLVGGKLALGFFEQQYDEETEDLSEVLICAGDIPLDRMIDQLCSAGRASLNFAEKEGITYSSISKLKKNLDQLMSGGSALPKT